MAPHFCLPYAFFLWNISHANDIRKQSNIIMSVIKPVIGFSPFRKTDRFDCKIPYKET